MFIFPLILFVSSRKLDSIVNKYKEQLANESTPEREEQAILWALAELSRQVDKSVTAEEVESEIGTKIREILERVEIADAVLRKDFNAMRFEFATTKESVNQLVQSAKGQILLEMQDFKSQLIESLQALVDTSSSAQEGWSKNSFEKVKDTFSSIKSSSTTRSIIFFVCFQVLLVFGLIFYRKLDAQLRMFL